MGRLLLGKYLSPIFIMFLLMNLLTFQPRSGLRPEVLLRTRDEEIPQATPSSTPYFCLLKCPKLEQLQREAACEVLQ